LKSLKGILENSEIYKAFPTSVISRAEAKNLIYRKVASSSCHACSLFKPFNWAVASHAKNNFCFVVFVFTSFCINLF
jgi:hypothetical protein